MLEANTIDDVGRAYDTVQENEVPIAMTLGRSTNEKKTRPEERRVGRE